MEQPTIPALYPERINVSDVPESARSELGLDAFAPSGDASDMPVVLSYDTARLTNRLPSAATAYVIHTALAATEQLPPRRTFRYVDFNEDGEVLGRAVAQSIPTFGRALTATQLLMPYEHRPAGADDPAALLRRRMTQSMFVLNDAIGKTGLPGVTESLRSTAVPFVEVDAGICLSAINRLWQGFVQTGRAVPIGLDKSAVDRVLQPYFRYRMHPADYANGI